MLQSIANVLILAAHVHVCHASSVYVHFIDVLAYMGVHIAVCLAFVEYFIHVNQERRPSRAGDGRRLSELLSTGSGGQAEA
jgi:hypothetical protein